MNIDAIAQTLNDKLILDDLIETAAENFWKWNPHAVTEPPFHGTEETAQEIVSYVGWERRYLMWMLLKDCSGGLTPEHLGLSQKGAP